MTTSPRKRSPRPAAKPQPVEPPAKALTPEAIGEFMGYESPDPDSLRKALDAALEAAADFFGSPLPAPSHAFNQGVRLVAAKLLLENRLEKPRRDQLPATAVYFWTTVKNGSPVA